ncbi:hypothetical protein [Nocardia iowensis]|uniref:Uncharacterized protein n=1 Tax=Nocardia iowensis TaxID=204891 RepID=A0ABX8RPH9_NOCIO|nr:hypothetical protein [Nocardia iowensis]QXN91498.1 hypothetical protein KV110_40405 [Nocardia iowensis]
MAWDQLPNLARAVLGSLIAIVFALFAASFVTLYELVARDTQGARYLAVAQTLAWTGIAASLIWAVVLMVGKLRNRTPIAWTPLIAVPLIIESWLVGFLIALVLASV